MPTRPRARTGLVATLPLALLAACSSPGAPSAAPSSTAATSTPDGHAGRPGAVEVAAAAPRLAVSYDGGVQVLDATTLEVVGDEEFAGFARVNPVGDGRHVLVSSAGAFRLLDTGAWAEPHGDHSHYYTGEVTTTPTAFTAEEPGHVVHHAGRTVLFDDGTGSVRAFDSAAVADADREVREFRTPAAHHGVAVELSDGRTLVSEGTEEARTGVRVLDAAGREIAADDRCPGVHGEAVAAQETVVVGCEDGVLVYRDGRLTKVDSPDAYGRIGNQAGSDASPVVLGDYKTDPDADPERPTRVSLVDTAAGTLRLVDLPSSYTFRSLGRDEDGTALVLGTDGALHVIDPVAGTLTRSIPVTAPWTEPDDWQQPRPALHVADGTAYVTDPATRSVHAVDVASGEVWKSTRLDVVPNELTGTTGEA